MFLPASLPPTGRCLSLSPLSASPAFISAPCSSFTHSKGAACPPDFSLSPSVSVLSSGAPELVGDGDALAWAPVRDPVWRRFGGDWKGLVLRVRVAPGVLSQTDQEGRVAPSHSTTGSARTPCVSQDGGGPRTLLVYGNSPNTCSSPLLCWDFDWDGTELIDQLKNWWFYNHNKGVLFHLFCSCVMSFHEVWGFDFSTKILLRVSVAAVKGNFFPFSFLMGF